mmetsp:Transcript_16727/g.36227  ORF Transcript_16727/g.36227 Transcript_16727/m.36227 type:complete len:225 (+) Transcript_16727:241-915(+)
MKVAPWLRASERHHNPAPAQRACTDISLESAVCTSAVRVTRDGEVCIDIVVTRGRGTSRALRQGRTRHSIAITMATAPPTAAKEANTAISAASLLHCSKGGVAGGAAGRNSPAQMASVGVSHAAHHWPIPERARSVTNALSSETVQRVRVVHGSRTWRQVAMPTWLIEKKCSCTVGSSVLPIGPCTSKASALESGGSFSPSHASAASPLSTPMPSAARKHSMVG